MTRIVEIKMQVTFPQPDKMNLVAYFLRDMFRSRLENKKAQDLARRMEATILFDASGMQACVTFKGDDIEITSSAPGKIDARISGDLSTLLDIALGANYFMLIARRKVIIAGNLTKLLMLDKLLNVK